MCGTVEISRSQVADAAATRRGIIILKLLAAATATKSGHKSCALFAASGAEAAARKREREKERVREKERELWEVQEVVLHSCVCPVHCPDAVTVAELPTILHHTYTHTLAALISVCKSVACVCVCPCMCLGSCHATRCTRRCRCRCRFIVAVVAL